MFHHFLDISLFGMAEGKPNCGCFGDVAVRPWISATIDALVIISLILSNPSRSSELLPREIRIRLAAFGFLAFVLGTIAFWPSVRNLTNPSNGVEVVNNSSLTPLDPPGNSPSNESLVDQILRRLDNWSAPQKLIHSI